MGMVDYLRDTKGELKHVNWPTRKQTVAFTVMVVVLSLVTGFGLGLLDSTFLKVLQFFAI